MKKQNYYIDWI